MRHIIRVLFSPLMICLYIVVAVIATAPDESKLESGPTRKPTPVTSEGHLFIRNDGVIYKHVCKKDKCPFYKDIERQGGLPDEY